jgi:hypothetical protein
MFPETGDRVTYLQEEWKVTAIDPSFHSAGLIATKITLNLCT